MVVCWVAFTPEGFLSFPTTDWSLRWFRAIARYPEFIAAFWQSLGLGALSSALAVGFSMVASYLLSSMFVPVISVWLIRRHGPAPGDPDASPSGDSRGQRAYARVLRTAIGNRKTVVAGYLAAKTERIHIGGGIFNPLPAVNHSSTHAALRFGYGRDANPRVAGVARTA